jgi:DNA mismatch repair protein MLH1
MMLEYFSLDILETGDVKTIPNLLREYTSNLDKLPMFLMRLGPQVCPNAILPFTDTNSP